MKVKIIGKKALTSQLKEMRSDIRTDVAKQMAIILAKMNKDVKDTINKGGRSGVEYKRGNRIRRRSAPGEPPKTDTGDLVSRFATKTKVSKNKVTGTLSNNSDHAAPLEFKPGSNGGRPFMRPLYNKWEPIAIKTFKASIKRSLRKNSK